MIITIAKPTDIPDLSKLLDILFDQEAEFTPNKEAQFDGLSEVIKKEDVGDILVAHHEGAAVGMLSLLYTVSTALGGRVGLLEDMVVLPAARGKKVGSALIEYAISFAKQKNCQRITLLTDNDNHDAHRFYQKHGFTASSMKPFRLNLNL